MNIKYPKSCLNVYNILFYSLMDSLKTFKTISMTYLKEFLKIHYLYIML
jgi:hypothetical protein